MGLSVERDELDGLLVDANSSCSFVHKDSISMGNRRGVKGSVTIAGRMSKDLAIGTWRSILRQAGLEGRQSS